MYSYSFPIEALKILRNGQHQDVIEYIKSYNNDGEFMYGIESDPYRLSMKEKMYNLLLDDRHSGGSWGFTIRAVQAVLLNYWTDQDLLDAKEKEEERYQLWLNEHPEIKERIEKERAEVLAENHIS